VNQIDIFSVTRRFNNDTLTPMSAYLNVNRPNTFLLESVDQGASVGRYSLIGMDAVVQVTGHDANMSVDVGGQIMEHNGNPLEQLNQLYRSISYNQEGEPPIKNGFFGYFSWDVMAAIESVVLQRSEQPLFQFQIPRVLMVLDHAQQVLWVTITSSKNDIDASEFDIILNQLYQPVATVDHGNVQAAAGLDWGQVASNMTQAEYESMVLKVKDHIKEGDIFQGVLSQQFRVPQDKAPLDVYRTLRHVNPSPYMVYFNYGDWHIIGSSPEILVKSTNGVATVRPIAGTRKRTFKNEEALIEDLKSDEKEIAEHVMLVDLGRNDLGRVCEYQSINSTDMMSVETYSHVIHMVTNVTGTLKQGMTPIDVFKATFPAGTVSGAPKIKAIEIINDCEPSPRGVYSGAIGYFNFDGDMDLCIAIRTIVARDGQYMVQAGGGIVNDSVPESEYNETKSKAQGILLACIKGDT
jgi:anthranilate synthase component I